MEKLKQIRKDYPKMNDNDLLKAFDHVKGNAVFYTKILEEERRLKKPDSYRYQKAQEYLNFINTIGPGMKAEIEKRKL